MPEYKDYELVGGQPVKISPFDAAAAGEGVHFAKEGCAFNPVIVSGGGNPNYVETIAGTLANPWGDVDVETVASQCLTDETTVYLLADATALGMQEIELAVQRGGISQTGIAFGAVEFQSGDNPSLNGVLVGFRRSTGAVYFATAEVAGVLSDLLPYANQIPTTLTIIHHPLPETP